MKVCFANSLLRPRRNGCVNCSSCEQSNGGSGEKDPKYLRLLQFSLLQSHINQIFFMFLRPEVQSHFHFLMSPLFLECQSEACQASPHLLWSRSVFPCCQFWTIPHKSASSNSSPSNARKEAIFCYSHSITSFKRALSHHYLKIIGWADK